MKRQIKMCLQEYIKKYYGETKPNIHWMRKKCREEKIPNAIQEGGRWYVVVDEEITTNERKKP
jgi:hypothetical protein